MEAFKNSWTLATKEKSLFEFPQRYLWDFDTIRGDLLFIYVILEPLPSQWLHAPLSGLCDIHGIKAFTGCSSLPDQRVSRYYDSSAPQFLSLSSVPAVYGMETAARSHFLELILPHHVTRETLLGLSLLSVNNRSPLVHTQSTEHPLGVSHTGAVKGVFLILWGMQRWSVRTPARFGSKTPFQWEK